MFVALLRQAVKFGVVFLYGSTGEIIIEKSGHLNLGIPGVMCFGAVGGCLGANMAKNAGLSDSGIIFVAIIMAMLFGAIMGLVYGLFTITLRCNQNVTGLTLTTLGTGVLGFWGRMMAKEGTTFVRASKCFTAPMFGAVGDDAFSQIFLSHGTLIYVSLIVAIIVAFVLKKTRKGLSLSAVGENPAAADAVGINVIGYKYTACVVGAAIAGLGGACYILTCTRGSLEYVVDAFGWLAVALVIFSLWRPGLGIIGSFIFGMLYIIASYDVIPTDL
ncbi:MAG: ABC transporter permease, partial [Christensenellaceae bacterium]|nr:ABC transporter permease [Christensenellaceae bacterium]